MSPMWSKVNNIELEQKFRERHHFLIRKFFNDFLEKQNKIDLNPNDNRVLNQEIENCCRKIYSLSLS